MVKINSNDDSEVVDKIPSSQFKQLFRKYDILFFYIIAFARDGKNLTRKELTSIV